MFLFLPTINKIHRIVLVLTCLYFKANDSKISNIHFGAIIYSQGVQRNYDNCYFWIHGHNNIPRERWMSQCNLQSSSFGTLVWTTIKHCKIHKVQGDEKRLSLRKTSKSQITAFWYYLVLLLRNIITNCGN